MANPIMKALSGVKNKVINATADVLSAPAQIKAARSKTKADSYTNALKLARSYNNAPGQNDDGSISDAGMARSLASDVKDKIKAGK